MRKDAERAPFEYSEKALRLPGNVRRRLMRSLETANALREIDAGEALALLRGESRRIEALAERAAVGGVTRLPSENGAPRILARVESLLEAGEDPLDEAALFDALRGRDYTQRELWAVPEALCVAIAKGYAATAEAVVRAARECAAAEAWSARPRRIRKAGSAFLEHALRRCDGNGRALLDKYFREHGIRPEQVLRQAHDARARDALRLNRLGEARQLVEELDWRRGFEAVSEAEAALLRDPSGVYPRMDDASRQAVRDALGEIAARSGLDEVAAARCAVAEARKIADADDPRATVCWWLYDDAGRRALCRALGMPGLRLRRRVPDPGGNWTALTLIALGAALTALACGLLSPWLLPLCVPVGWAAALALAGRVFPWCVRPARLLKLELDRLPEACRTLIVTPVSIPNARRALDMCDNLEALGALEDDPNLCCLLLGDFADADSEHMPGDADILATVNARIAEMNARAGWEKFFYLHRPRTLLKPDMRWMGRDRKRGALEDLNRLLTGGASAFTAEGRAARALRGGFAYVVTLDSDTRMLPGTAHVLVGALAHPLNRRYAVLQPRMETAPSACVNRFSRFFAAPGGLDSYPTSVSSLWMDLTGVGVYGGKGVYRVADFHRALDGQLPRGRILSHDLIEGALAGAGFLGDVMLADGCPSTLSAWLRRLHRWTRGDWQLVGLVFTRRGLTLADRARMVDNLLRSLLAPAQLGLALVSAWTGNPLPLAAALVSVFQSALLRPTDGASWLRACASLAALPLTASCCLDAALRALWRMVVSGKGLLDWVPSAEAEGQGRGGHYGHYVAALLSLVGLFTHGGALPLILAALFSLGPVILRLKEGAPATDAAPLSDAQRSRLWDLARDTWRFFEAMDAPLPPDNIQLDPPAAPARRTSPTNIGLYLLSCAAAAKLGIIDGQICLDRVTRALDALEAAPKWRGHIFNWIDIDTREPLSPRYVSSVDSGNLAACALACAALLDDAALSNRLRALAEGMDFTALYDAKRELFHIGMDVDADRLTPAHYDLLASEARILSYTAILLGQVPPRHWKRLGRLCAPVGRRAALLSWSGTLFEYLMPELLMRAPALSLLGISNRAAVAAQIAAGTPWGVSESGYHAFDGPMNYQYRAFGLKALALSDAVGGVVAPYASALALAVMPDAAARNLERMADMGWRGDMGFYEAADYRRPGGPALVMSHMAHHQGMLLCAVCNALTDDSLCRAFMDDPRARAVSLLLEERPACPSRLRAVKRPAATAKAPAASLVREARGPAEVHLLMGRDAHAFVTADGAVHYARGGFDATRFGDDLYYRPDAARLWLRVGERVFAPEWRCRFDAGCTVYELSYNRLSVRMTVSLSPEDDVLYRAVEVTNGGASAAEISLMDVVPVALAKPEDMRAHAAFQRLFVESSRWGEDGLRFKRRPRRPGERCPVLLHRLKGGDALAYETDYDALMRRGTVPTFELTGGLGAVLDPVSAIRADMTLSPGETRRLCAAMKLCADGEAEALPLRPDRAARLGHARTAALLGFFSLSQSDYHTLDRLAALLIDPHLAGRAKPSDNRPAQSMPRSALWALGLSGDRPIVTLILTDPDHAGDARRLLAAHAFYSAMGIQMDLALADACPGGYRRPGAEALTALIDASPLRGREGQPGGVWVLSDLDATRLDSLKRASALCFTSGPTLPVQCGALLSALAGEPPETPVDPGRSHLQKEERLYDNGWGGFDGEGRYHIDVSPDRPTPAPWCDILANRDFGMLLTERGGGFMWRGNSRSDRLTAFEGDAPFLSLRARRTQTGEALPLLPHGAKQPFRAIYDDGEVLYRMDTDALAGEVAFRVDGDAAIMDVLIENRRLRGRGWTVCLDVRWLMGTDARDAAWLRRWHGEGACFAAGTMPGVGYVTCDAADAMAGDGLCVPMHMGRQRLRFVLGWAEDAVQALEQVRAWQEGRKTERHREPPALTVETPDAALNLMLNKWLPHQVHAARLDGRTGFYQPGGAYGFRDQLQDVLALLYTEPSRVREQLLLCAGRQFSAGDALHWWHMPYAGVRTRITDDRLFLPWVTAAYVRVTGDAAVLEERIPYLEDMEIPEGQADVYREMVPGPETGTLHDHCMRAFRAAKTGAHGLALMGAGDWNDGMDRVGAQGAGESVWLSMFVAACADAYADICPDPDDAEVLRGLGRRHRGAVELYGWDGDWYRRAYADDGTVLGGRESDACQIDLLPQAWATLAGLSEARCRRALDAAWHRLADEEHGLIRLLDPPFALKGFDPGYIRGYPGGVRENGAQYTHAACWLMLALARAGDAERAHRVLRWLLPPNRADAERYRVEPYVTAADVYTLPGREGRGGWTWYTGSAAWLYVAALELLGFERKGSAARLNALLGDWPEAAVTLRVGGSVYRLVCRRGVERVTLDGRALAADYITLTDDGGEHEALFPERKA